MKKRYILILMMFIIGLWSCDWSCDGTPIETMTLQPEVFRTWVLKEQDKAEFSCWPLFCFHSHGTACPSTVNPATQIEVGYNYHYDNGTLPCNCWWYVDCVYRGEVRFDLSALQGKNIVAAKLKWSERGACAAKLHVPDLHPSEIPALSPLNEISNPWGPYPPGPGELEVGSFVRDWVLGNAPNRGFVFAGSDESFPHKLWVDGDAEIGPPAFTHCTSPVGGCSLEVKYKD